MSPEDAEEFIDAHGQSGQAWWRMSALGLRLGVPEALGIDRAEYGRRLGGYFRLPVDERREAVAELVDDGLTQREIAAVLGVGNGTVAEDVAQNRAKTEPEQDECTDTAQNRADEGPPPPLEESMAKLDQAATLTDVLQAERAEREAAEQSARETSTAEMNELRDACRRLLDVLIVIDHLPAHEQTEAEDWLRELKKELERHA